MNHIIAELLHPEILGPPLERGTRYGHHFVVDLISNGRHLVAVASEEGRKLLHEIENGIDPDAPNPPDPSNPVSVGDQSGTGTVLVTAQSGTDALSPGPQQTGADAPTTTVSSANTFDN